ncbi:sulfatase-like hydrolase/transferase [Streptomyces anulatus]|uniref:sulfatase-like hydrolase/transferase n=1 Tax=Streptomyces anulatus TaxID=1892 RepID=UPI0036DD9F88
MPDRPFFCYFAPGATHPPHHVPTEWSDRYRGRFDQGWDAIREEIIVRQKELGVVPENAELTRCHAEIPARDGIPAELRPVLARQMEVYAGFLTHTDHHIGRLVAALEELGILDDTLMYVITGDNGASAEGGLRGSFNELLAFNGMARIETPEFMASRIDKFGTPEAFNHDAVGWAHAMDTPYQWTKQVASHWGGTRNGTILHWPSRIRAAGENRRRFSHLIDVAPTVLEAAGIPEPTTVNGVQQSPMEGVSMLYSFDGADAPERHDQQYFEMFGNRGIYHKGWSAVTKHRTPWVVGGEQLAFDDDVWELYDGSADPSQAHDLASEMPDKLHELQRLWLMEAARHNVLPMDDRTAERFNAEIAGRPELITSETQLLYGGMVRLSESSQVNVKNKSFSVTAEIASTDGPFEGVILAQGGGIGKGGAVSLYYDGDNVGGGRVEHTLPFIFSADETADVGGDSGTPVAPDYNTMNGAFTGDIHWVQVDTGPNDADHYIRPEDRIRIAMGRQ